jgi:hypothetical protein
MADRGVCGCLLQACCEEEAAEKDMGRDDASAYLGRSTNGSSSRPVTFGQAGRWRQMPNMFARMKSRHG